MSNNKSSDDFWDLDDDDLDLELSPPPSPPGTSTDPDQEQADEPDHEVSPQQENEQTLEPISEAAPSPQPASEPEPTQKRRKEIKVKGKGIPVLSRMTLIEKISVLAVFLILGGVASWGISLYYSHAPEGELIEFNDDFPVQGESVTISELDTWWRPPIREGENADRGVRLQTNLIPCARIKIEDTENALLWVTFRNGDQDLVGDPINLIVSNGVFLDSGTAETEIHATSGFENPSEINAYTNGDIDPWSVVIVEGKVGDEFSPESEPFIKVLLEAKVPDEKEVE